MYLRMLSETLVGATIVQSDNDTNHLGGPREKIYRYKRVQGHKERMKPCKKRMDKVDENEPAAKMVSVENKDNANKPRENESMCCSPMLSRQECVG